MIEHHSLSCTLNASTIIVKVYWTEVFGTPNIDSICFSRLIVRRGVRELGFILFMLLLN